MQKFIKNTLRDLQVELKEEFDLNFTRKAFFDQPWKQTKLQNNRGSLLVRSGDLRRSIRTNIEGQSIHFTSALPYASIQNEGGTIVVTSKMKKFFWAMYYKSSGAIGKGSKKRNERLSIEAQQWKNLALMKVGQKIKIEQLQFIGWHPRLEKKIISIIDSNFKEIDEYIKNKLKR